jgi:hypothetical protein
MACEWWNKFYAKPPPAAFDAGLFSTTAATDAAPAGLLHGISPQVPATGGTPNDDMTADLKTLIGAVARAASAGPLAIIGAPEQITSLKLRAPTEFRHSVLATSGVPAGSVIVIALNALASAVGEVEIDVSRHAVLHMEAASPAPISTVGTPNVAAAPARSLFQTDTLAARLRLEVSWGLRGSGALAFVTGVSW